MHYYNHLCIAIKAAVLIRFLITSAHRDEALSTWCMQCVIILECHIVHIAGMCDAFRVGHWPVFCVKWGRTCGHLKFVFAGGGRCFFIFFHSRMSELAWPTWWGLVCVFLQSSGVSKGSDGIREKWPNIF